MSTQVHYHTLAIDGVDLFYREAGSPDAPITTGPDVAGAAAPAGGGASGAGVPAGVVGVGAAATGRSLLTAASSAASSVDPRQYR